jgi:non-ribosomal peptide synthetase component F
VALHLPRSTEFLTALLAVFKAQAVYVPVDPAYPAAYAKRIVDNARPALVLVADNSEATFDTPGVQLMRWQDPRRLPDRTTPLPPATPRLEEAAYIAYTSGSTGEPKGVCVSHRQLMNCLQSLCMEIPFAADEVMAQKTSTMFVVSIKELLAGLLRGVPQVIFSDFEVRDTPVLAEALRWNQISRLNLVPSHLEALLEYSEMLAGLRYVVTAGEPLSQSLRRRFEALLPEARLYNNYGCTELNDVTYCAPGEQDASAFVPMGRPIANTRLHVLDEEMNPVPHGVPGELFVEARRSAKAIGTGPI